MIIIEVTPEGCRHASIYVAGQESHIHSPKTQLRGFKRKEIGLKIIGGKKLCQLYNEQIAALNSDELFNSTKKLFLGKIQKTGSPSL